MSPQHTATSAHTLANHVSVGKVRGDCGPHPRVHVSGAHLGFYPLPTADVKDSYIPFRSALRHVLQHHGSAMMTQRRGLELYQTISRVSTSIHQITVSSTVIANQWQVTTSEGVVYTMSTRKPIIGITPSPMEDTQPHGTFNRYAMATTYTEAIEAAGGVPVIIPPQVGNIQEILSVVDGLLISGGGDIRPDRYGDTEIHDTTYGVHDLRDELELALVREATSRDIPMLCICRGIQILNVALGGSLIQDIADQYSTEIEHRQQNDGVRKEEPSHAISATPGSLLARTYEAETIQVNSFHHQAIRELAADLALDAVSADEVIEGVSHPGSSWILGVQWHPEMMFREHPEHLKPFSALVAEASKKAALVTA